ncbi:MAG: hypothetical protein R3B47_04675 [Bacteroidia bacterium]
MADPSSNTEVAINPNKLASYGLSLADVFEALQNNNSNTGGAYIEKITLPILSGAKGCCAIS